ncbi:class I SAM-dependent methyltransferase [Desulfitibacter alkalitolerans]|uniref:class I SAM-dependent methyltransferase n=1 Tax=Desulfitibacter alkalitolerans TaxID=264641 RepID=UPI00048498EF|nr:class I SAM-dependent methyltransferase [Desulfitibacter alkalitolerans]
MSDIFARATSINHDFISRLITPGDKAVDATVGNGHDTIFLANLVGDTGKVYGFDIQDMAIERTKNLLSAHNLSNRVLLIADGHENIDKYIQHPVKVIMFNLGYLPGGDHGIITREETTIAALKKSLSLLTPHGVLSVVVYSRHHGGEREKQAVESFFESIPKTEFHVVKINHLNRLSSSPYIIIAQRND